MTHRFKILAGLIAAAGLALAAGSAGAQLRSEPQVLIQSTFVEVGGGVSFARGEIGVDFNDPLLNDVSESFSKTRGFLGLGLAATAHPFGHSIFVFGADGQIFFDDELFDLDFNLPGNQVRATGRNAFNITPFIGIEFALDEALEAAEAQSRMRIFAGPTISDQKVTVVVDDGFNRERRSASDLIVSPTVSARLVVTNVIVPEGETLALGGLIMDIAADARVTFPGSLPGLGDIPLLGAAFRQKRDAEFSAGLLILITPRIVPGAE